MKFHTILLGSVAVLLAAGCGPKNPPSGAGELDTPVDDGTTKGPVTPITGDNPAVDPNFPSKANTSALIKNAGGDLSKIPDAAKLAIIHFGFDKYNVESGERAKIDAIIGSIKNKNVAIWGYTDYHGTSEYNLGLSDKRANSVKTYLAGHGVANTEATGYGEQFAAQSGDKNAVADDRKAVIIDLDYKGN